MTHRLRLIAGATVVAAAVAGLGATISEGAVSAASGSGIKQFSLSPGSALAPNSVYGYSIAASGTTVVSGALGQNVAGHTRAGAVYVFERPAQGWRSVQPVATLTSPNPQDNGQFGVSVAISGNTIVVGANDEYSNAGVAYVFTEPKHGWRSISHPTATLHLATPQSGDRFGAAVGISGNTIIADVADGDVGTQTDAGSIAVFIKPTTGWRNGTPAAVLTSSDEVTDDFFGGYLSISGDVVVGGSYVHNSYAGEAALFVKPPGGWVTGTETRMLSGTALAPNDYFGAGVSVSPNTIVVSAQNHLANPTSHGGAVFVYEKPAGGWGSSSSALAPTAEISETNGQTGSDFGASVAIVGGLLLVGADTDTVGSATQQGAVYPMLRPAGGWQTTTVSSRLVAVNGRAGDRLGVSVAFSGNEIVSGASDANSDRGATYLWAQPGPKLAKVTQSRKSWGLGHARPTTNPKHVSKKVGTAFGLTLDQAATVTMSFSEKRHGHFKHVGSLRFAASAGRTEEYVAGKLGHHKKLKPGHCKVKISASNGNGRTSAKTLRFTTQRAR